MMQEDFDFFWHSAAYLEGCIFSVNDTEGGVLGCLMHKHECIGMNTLACWVSEKEPRLSVTLIE